MSNELFNVDAALKARQAILDKERQADEVLAEAHALIERKDYKGALRGYKKFFQLNHDDVFRPWERDLRVLVKNYGPALTLVRRWRNDKERIILAGRADRRLVDEWVALNKALKEKERLERIYWRLKESNAGHEVLEPFLSYLWKDFVRRRRYNELRAYLRHLGFLILVSFTEHDCNIWFSRWRSYETFFDYNYERIIDIGPPTYELALGLGELDLASHIARGILRVEGTDKVYASLIKAALHARAYEQAIQLYTQAKSTLGSRRMRETNKVFRTMPPNKSKAKVGK